jgi:hypothetical protein
MFETPVLMLSSSGEVFQIFVGTRNADRLFTDLQAAGFHGRKELGAFRAGEREEEVSIIFLDDCDKHALKEWLKNWRVYY